MNISATNRRGLGYFVGIMVFAAIVCYWIPFVALPGSHISPGIPVITVPGEAVIHHWKPFGIDFGADFSLLNTMIAMFIVDAIVLLFVFLAYRYSNGWRNQVPGRIQVMAETLAGGIYSLCKSIGGDAGRRVFPLVATIFFFLLLSNYLGIVPGLESVGVFHCAHPDTSGYAGRITTTGLYTLDNDHALNSGYGVTLEDNIACIEATGLGELSGREAKNAVEEHLITKEQIDAEGNAILPVPENLSQTELQSVMDQREPGVDNKGQPIQVPVYKFHITPFVRSAATDLNLTLALAIISFLTIQAFGFYDLGLNYMQKFIPIHSLGMAAKNPLGLMDLIVGPLELLSELSKIISLSFRLFGNIFAGASLVAVMLFLVGSGIPMVFYFLELIVGFMQALVFAALTLVFTSQAVQSHVHDEEHEPHVEHQ